MSGSEDKTALVTTLPAKAGSFRTVRRRLLQQELLRLRSLQPATFTPEGSIQARPRGLDVPTKRPSRWFFSLYAGGCESNSAEEHLGRPTPAGKRHRFYPVAFPREPGEPMSLVKVLIDSATTWVACQAGSALRVRATFPRRGRKE